MTFAWRDSTIPGAPQPCSPSAQKSQPSQNPEIAGLPKNPNARSQTGPLGVPRLFLGHWDHSPCVSKEWGWDEWMRVDEWVIAFFIWTEKSHHYPWFMGFIIYQCIIYHLVMVLYLINTLMNFLNGDMMVFFCVNRLDSKVPKIVLQNIL